MDRTTRIAEEIKKEVSVMLQNELKDPRVTGLISITKVLLTKDLKYCKIYVSSRMVYPCVHSWTRDLYYQFVGGIAF